jgi:transposase-like protein
MVCKICSDRRRLDIDRELVRAGNISKIAKKFGVSYGSLYAHRKKCVTRQLLKSEEMRQMLTAQNLFNEIDFLVEKSKDILERADVNNEHMVSLRAISELRASYEFLTRLAVQFKEVMAENEKKKWRWEVDALKEKFIREELELLQLIYNKKPGEILVSVKFMPASSLARKHEPTSSLNHGVAARPFKDEREVKPSIRTEKRFRPNTF